MSKAKKHVLVVNESSDFIESIAAKMQRFGYSFGFAFSKEEILFSIDKIKPNIIILSDYGDSVDIVDAMKFLHHYPETRNVRVVVLTKQANPSYIEEILFLGIRDIVPRTFSKNNIIKRINFATRGNEAEYLINEQNSLPCMEELNVEIFSKVISISVQEIILETPLMAGVDQILYLRLPCFKELGLNRIKTVVEEVKQRDLIYNMNRSLVLKPQLSNIDANIVGSWITQHMKVSTGKRIPIYVALKEKKLRRDISRLPVSDTYFFRFAWSTSTVFMEPVYLSPRIIFIDDVFIDGETSENFMVMLEKLEHRTFIVINDRSKSPKLKTFIHSLETYHQILFFNDMQLDKIRIIIEDLVEKLRHRRAAASVFEDNKTLFLAENHSFSNGFLLQKAKLQAISDNEFQFSMECNVTRFNYVKVGATFLDQKGVLPAYAKIFDAFNRVRPSRISLQLKKKYSRVFYYNAYFVCFPAVKRLQLRKFLLEKLLSDNTRYLERSNQELEIDENPDAFDQEAMVNVVNEVPVQESVPNTNGTGIAKPLEQSAAELMARTQLSGEINTEEKPAAGAVIEPRLSMGVEEIDPLTRYKREQSEKSAAVDIPNLDMLNSEINALIDADVDFESDEENDEILEREVLGLDGISKDLAISIEEERLPAKSSIIKEKNREKHLEVVEDQESKGILFRALKIVAVIFISLLLLLVGVVYVFPLMQKGNKISSTRLTESFRHYMKKNQAPSKTVETPVQ